MKGKDDKLAERAFSKNTRRSYGKAWDHWIMYNKDMLIERDIDPYKDNENEVFMA